MSESELSTKLHTQPIPQASPAEFLPVSADIGNTIENTYVFDLSEEAADVELRLPPAYTAPEDGPIPQAYVDSYRSRDRKVRGRLARSGVLLDGVDDRIKKTFEDAQERTDAELGKEAETSARNHQEIEAAKQRAIEDILWQVRIAHEQESTAHEDTVTLIETRKDEADGLYHINRKAARHIREMLEMGTVRQSHHERNRERATHTVIQLDIDEKRIIIATATARQSLARYEATLSEYDKLKRKLESDRRDLLIEDLNERDAITEPYLSQLRNDWGVAKGEESPELLAIIAETKKNARSMKLADITQKLETWQSDQDANERVKTNTDEAIDDLEFQLQMLSEEIAAIPAKRQKAQDDLRDEVLVEALNLNISSKQLIETVEGYETVLDGEMSFGAQQLVPGDLREVHSAIDAIVKHNLAATPDTHELAREPQTEIVFSSPVSIPFRPDPEDPQRIANYEENRQKVTENLQATTQQIREAVPQKFALQALMGATITKSGKIIKFLHHGQDDEIDKEPLKG
jgi:hypothetical protein